VTAGSDYRKSNTTGRRSGTYDERASLRSWLYDAVPTLDDSPFASREEVKQSIDDAIEEVDPDEFDPDELVNRVEAAQSR